ncbi:MAG: DUF2934 domain-containing protein [Neorhizobium sp.]|nr:DUF2934 domain-containing protein [Neorhizobium sp.]
MADSNEDWIKRRAYELWEEEGYPSGKDHEHWERAKLEFVTLKPVAGEKPAKAAKAKAPKSDAVEKPVKAKVVAKAPAAKKPVASATKPAAAAAKSEAAPRKKSKKLATAS